MAWDETKQADDYFYYSNTHYSNYDWVKVKGVRLEDVTCKQPGCTYKPQTWCEQPVRAYKAHLRKYHSAEWLRMKTKDYIIREEPELDASSWYRELADA
jgi:hypothetical protein